MTSATHPLDLGKTLFQIGHEPIAPKHTKTCFWHNLCLIHFHLCRNEGLFSPFSLVLLIFKNFQV